MAGLIWPFRIHTVFDLCFAHGGPSRQAPSINPLAGVLKLDELSRCLFHLRLCTEKLFIASLNTLRRVAVVICFSLGGTIDTASGLSYAPASLRFSVCWVRTARRHYLTSWDHFHVLSSCRAV